MTFMSIEEFLAQIGKSSLTDAERNLIKCCQKGEACVFNSGIRPNKESNSTSIRAELLRLLITGGSESCKLHRSGLQLKGAWIKGKLNLRFSEAQGTTEMVQCHFVETPDFFQARMQRLNVSGSKFPGLQAYAIEVRGSFLLNNVISTGEIHLAAARVGHKLDVSDANLEGKLAEGKWRRALYAERAVIGNSLFLKRLKAIGRVVVTGAKIGGTLSFLDAKIEGKTEEKKWKQAIVAERTVVGGSFFLKGVSATGRVALQGARIDGLLHCEGAIFDGKINEREWGIAFRAERTHVEEAFIWKNIKIAGGVVNLSYSHFGYLNDDKDSWPRDNEQLNLSGLTYERIAGREPAKEKWRLAWLYQGSNTDGLFHPQPYTQYSRALRSMGHEHIARVVLIEREKLVARQTRTDRNVQPNGDWNVAFLCLWQDIRNFFSWVFDFLLRKLTGYGYRPKNSFLALAVLFSIAVLIADLAWKEGSFAPNSDVVLTSSGWKYISALDCLPVSFDGCISNPANVWSGHDHAGFDWDTFHPAAYAADLVIPVVNFGQNNAWSPSRDRGFWGRVLWQARWCIISLGWIFTGFGAAAISGIIQKDRE